MTKFYFAAPFVHKQTAKMLAVRIAHETGWQCTARWLDGGHDADDQASDAQKIRFAAEDLNDIDASQVFVHWYPSASVYQGRHSGGRHVELGYAMAQQKRIVLLGRRENLFHWLADEVYPSIDDLIAGLKGEDNE